jgi:flagellar export protein FliJ
MSVSRRFSLSAVLRARQAQEDIAKGTAARARRDAARALDAVADREQALERRPVLPSGTALAFVAAAAAGRHLAADLAAATELVGQADDLVRERTGELSVAMVRRRVLERLAERHAAAQRRAEEAAEQRLVDDLVTSRQAPRRAPVGAPAPGTGDGR